MWVHGFSPVMLKGSDLQTPPHPKNSNETTLPDKLLTSWNWYFVFRKITEEVAEKITADFESMK